MRCEKCGREMPSFYPCVQCGHDDVKTEPVSKPDSSRKLGTPISELSGRPGHSGYDRFVAIAKSWGYD